MKIKELNLEEQQKKELIKKAEEEAKRKGNNAPFAFISDRGILYTF